MALSEQEGLLRLVRMLEVHGVQTGALMDLARLTIYAVQFRYDAELPPLGLQREQFNDQVRLLLEKVEAIVRR